MSGLKINPVNQSSTQPFGPTHELFNGLNAQGSQIADIEKRLRGIEQANIAVDSLCKSYKDLHSYRIISLISIPICLSVVYLVVLLYLNVTLGQVEWLLKILFGSTVFGLVFEAFWLPNKIKEMNKRISDQNNSHESLVKDISSIKLSIESLRQPEQQEKKKQSPKKQKAT
jgi:hypothetical protein